MVDAITIAVGRYIQMNHSMISLDTFLSSSKILKSGPEYPLDPFLHSAGRNERDLLKRHDSVDFLVSTIVALAPISHAPLSVHV